MTTPDQVLFDTNEQILSSDLNRMGTLTAKAVQDALLAMGGSIDALVAPQDVVRRGLNATVGVGLSVDISAGEAMRFDGPSAGDATGYHLGRIDNLTNLPIAAADPGQPRLDLVYATFSLDAEDSGNRNIIDPVTRIVSSVSVDKSSRPRLTLGVVTGTPAANPSKPALPASAIALWYVYVPAAAVAVVDDHLIDARRRMHPHALAFKHEREQGLVIGADPNDNTLLQFVGGTGWSNGAKIQADTSQSYVPSSLLASGSGTILAAQLYHVYAVALGQGNDAPVGKNVPNGIVPVIITAIDPDPDGRPSAPITYRPLLGAAPAADTLQFSTDQALYLGSVRAGSVNDTFQEASGGAPLSRDGQRTSSLDVFGGFSFPAWLSRPRMTWTSATEVTIGACSAILNGVPMQYPGGVADITTDLFSGEVEANNTWIYFYLRKVSTGDTFGRKREATVRMSLQAPDGLGRPPTPEAGFGINEYIYIGSVFNDFSGDLYPFERDGYSVKWLDRLSLVITPTINPARSTFAAIAPATCRSASFNYHTVVNPGGLGAFAIRAQIFSGTGRATPHLEFRYSAEAQTAADFMPVNLDFAVPLNSSRQWQWLAVVDIGAPTFATPAFDLFQTGYTENQ